ncbi:MAG: archease [Endomicrobia bacterium]|nr:archease [Endomicrobiia bacterium]
MMLKKFDFIEHTADVGIVVYAKTYNQLFENAAYGMYNIICENFTKIADEKKYDAKISEIDLETLLVSFLNDLLYQTFVNKVIFCKFRIEELVCNEGSYNINFAAYGEDYNVNKHGRLLELKAATFHGLKIEKSFDTYTVTIIFDT